MMGLERGGRSTLLRTRRSPKSFRSGGGGRMMAWTDEEKRRDMEKSRFMMGSHSWWDRGWGAVGAQRA